MALDFPSNPTNGQVYDNFIYDSTKGIWKSLSSGASPSILVNPTITNAVISATAPNATTVPLTVKGAASQSANLQEWKNSSGTTLLNINSVGDIYSSGRVETSGKVVGTTQPNAGSDGGVAIKAPASGTQTSAYLQFVNNAYSVQYGAVSADPNGYITMSGSGVKTPSQPCFFAYRNDGLWATQTWVANQTYFNVGGYYNTSNGRFTAPVAGKYFFGLNSIGNTSGTTRLYPRINGNTQFGGFHLRAINTANYADAHMTWIYSLAAGDYVDILIGENYNYSDTTPYAYWHGFLLH